MKLADFMTLVVTQARISVVTEQGLDDKLITLDVNQQPLSQVLNAVARRLGVDVTRSGDLWYIGNLRSEDRATLVRRVRRLAVEDLGRAVETVLSSKGQLYASPDGLLIVSDRLEILARVESLLDSIEKASTPVWVLQYHLVLLRRDDLRRLQVDFAPTGKMAFTFAAASLLSAPTATQGLTANAALDAVLDAADTDDNRHTVMNPLMLISDGEQSQLHSGQEIPIPRTETTEFGTTRDIGYDTVTTGLTVDSTIREQSAERMRLELRLELNSLEGFNGAYPITSGSRFSTAATLHSGGVYLLGQVNERTVNHGRRGGWKWGQEHNSTDRVLQIYVRTYRIGGDVGGLGGKDAAPAAATAAAEEFERLPAAG